MSRNCQFCFGVAGCLFTVFARNRSAPSSILRAVPRAEFRIPPSPPVSLKTILAIRYFFKSRALSPNCCPTLSRERVLDHTANLAAAITVAHMRSDAANVALSRRKQGFESPRERQSFQCISDPPSGECPGCVPATIRGPFFRTQNNFFVENFVRVDRCLVLDCRV
jgi:hypothetical protein